MRNLKIKNFKVNIKDNPINGDVLSTATCDYYNFHAKLKIVYCAGDEEMKSWPKNMQCLIKSVVTTKLKNGTNFTVSNLDTKKELSAERFMHMYDTTIDLSYEEYKKS